MTIVRQRTPEKHRVISSSRIASLAREDFRNYVNNCGQILSEEVERLLWQGWMGMYAERDYET